MTPKEKAAQIVEDYMLITNEYKEHIDFSAAQKCGIRLVDAILYEFDHTVFHDDDYADYKIKYWKEVKQQINML